MCLPRSVVYVSALAGAAIALTSMVDSAIAQPTALYAQSIGDPALPSDPVLDNGIVLPEDESEETPDESEETSDDGFLTPDPNAEFLEAEDLATELGEIQPLPQTAQASGRPSDGQPNGQLLLRSSVFSSSNVTGATGATADDLVFVNQATLLATPALGPDTRLIATAGGGLTRFANEGGNNYNSLGFSLAVQQRLTPTTYAQVGWVQDQLFDTGSGDRTLMDNSARALIGRQDQLTEKLRLDTSYELRARFTDPAERSRIGNSLGLQLRYDLDPNWQTALGYRLALDEYTQNGRADTLHQLQAATTYLPSQETFVTGFAAYAFGNSSESTVDLSNLSFGLSMGVNLRLF
jgi:hypothetical protein